MIRLTEGLAWPVVKRSALLAAAFTKQHEDCNNEHSYQEKGH
jgi:hypothetical protein